MVRKFVAGMRALPTPVLALFGLLALLAVSLLFMRPARATAFSDPHWLNNTSAMECASCSGCGCEAPFLTPERVVPMTGELIADFTFFSTPGKSGSTVFGSRWRSMIDGTSQMGRGMVPSWETTIEKVIVNSGNPNAAHGHYYNARYSTGRIDVFDWNGSSYDALSCGSHDTLTTVSSVLRITDKWGNYETFDSRGMPATYVDRNGNTTTLSYDSSMRLTSYTTDRSKSISISLNSNDFISQLSDPFSFGYDSSNNLHTITTPATADQSSGITTTLAYDSSNRLTSVTDGRGNATSYTYVSATRQIASVTRNSNAVSYTYASGRTDRTDANGNVHRYHYTGNKVTKTDMYVSGQAKYVTEYRYSGDDLVTIVYPLGNRVDYTVDGSGNRTAKRRKTTDTSSTSSSDIYETWGYTNNFVVSYHDPLTAMNLTTYTRDGYGNVTQIGFPNVSQPASQSSVTKSFTYNSSGQLTQVTDEEGKVTTYTYFSSGGANYGLLQKVEVDPSGLDLTTTYGYDSAFNVNSVTDPRGNATTTTWDAVRRKTSVVAPSPLTAIETDFHYDGNGNVTEVSVHNVDKDGTAGSNAWLSTTCTYTAEDRLATLVEETDSTHTRTATFAYDANGNRTSVTKPESNVDAWTYNERDLVATHVRGYGATGAATTTYSYDDNGNLTTLTDARSKTTTFTFDLFDRRTKTTNALGHYEETDYDKASQVTEVRRYDSTPNPDVLLQRSTLYYDARQRHWKTSDLFSDPSTTYSDAVTITERFKTGHGKKVTNARSKDTTYTYDNAWRLTKTTDAMGNEFANSYDANGNRTAWSILEKDGTSNVTHEYEASFDVVNRKTEYREKDRTSSTNTLTTTYAYDSRGNLTFLVNAEGNPTRWTFDDLGRMTKKEVALTLGSTINDFSTAIVTQWGFDKNDRLVSFKDDANNESTWTYDALDRQATMTYPTTSPAQTVSCSYDGNDNVTSLTDPAGNVIADTFDDLNRNTARTVTLATGFTDTTSESRAFDALNRMTSTQDDDYKVEYTYGVNGLASQVYEEKQSYATGTAYAKTVTRTYDTVGNKATEAYPHGLSLTCSYNDVDRYSSISDGTNTIASWSYIGVRQKKATFQNGATATNTYTGFRSEIATIKHETSTPTTILELDYGYNKVHDRSYERYGASGSSGDAFTYDKAERLTTAYMGSSTPTNPTGSGVTYVTKIDYNMDHDGNRTSVVTTPYGQSASTSSYSTNNKNQYTSVGGTSRNHDANGNVTDTGTYKFKFNYKNLICEARLSSNNNLVATYTYDALGRRVGKAVSGGATTRFVYSGLETIETYDGSNQWKQDFVFGQGIDEVLMLQQADVLDYDSDSNTTEVTRAFYHRNAVGSVMEISDGAQANVESYRYTPYGEPTITRNSQTQTTDALAQHRSYTGREYEEETGIHYFRGRYFAPSIGRFLQRDPLGYLSCPNVYTYASNCPASRVDPLGLDDDDRPWDTPWSPVGPSDRPQKGRVEGLDSASWPGEAAIWSYSQDVRWMHRRRWRATVSSWETTTTVVHCPMMGHANCGALVHEPSGRLCREWVLVSSSMITEEWLFEKLEDEGGSPTASSADVDAFGNVIRQLIAEVGMWKAIGALMDQSMTWKVGLRAVQADAASSGEGILTRVSSRGAVGAVLPIAAGYVAMAAMASAQYKHIWEKTGGDRIRWYSADGVGWRLVKRSVISERDLGTTIAMGPIVPCEGDKEGGGDLCGKIAEDYASQDQK